jgi:hypothetical protein
MKSLAAENKPDDENDSEMQHLESESIQHQMVRNADLKLEDKKQVLKDFWN